MQIIPFRLFLSWSIVIIFLKPILRIFEFYRILYPMYKFQIFQSSQITFFIRLRNNPPFRNRFSFSKRPPRLSPRKPNNDFEIHYSKLKVISFPSPV